MEPFGTGESFMTALTLKSLPDNLVDRLRSAAEAAHRSVNKEIIHRLEKSFDRDPSTERGDEDKFRVREQVEAWSNLPGTWESDLSIEQEIEALYTARTLGRDVKL